MMQFIRALFGAHGKKAVQSVVDQAVAFDPATATEAQLQVMEDDLKKASKLVAELQQAASRETREAEDVRKRFNIQKNAAMMLHQEWEVLSEGDPKKTELHASLTALLGELEELQEEVRIEEGEAEEAQAFLAEAEAVLKEKGAALLNAKKELTKAGRSLEQAKLRRDRAEAQAETAAQVAGLRDGSRSSMSGALQALTAQADKANAEAAAARLKAEALKKPELGTARDPNVQRALAAAKNGGSLPSPVNLSERLVALGAPMPQKPASLPAPEATAS